MTLLQSLQNVAASLMELLAVLARTAWPWVPLFAWIAFWTFAVDWVKLFPVLTRKFGLIGIGLLAFMAVLIWSVVAPPPDGFHHLFGLTIGNVTGKLVYVTALIVIAALCASVQLSGCCGPWVQFDEPSSDAYDNHGHAGEHDHDHAAGHQAPAHTASHAHH